MTAAAGHDEVAEGLIRYDDGRVGCWWAGDDPLYRAYHDHEWGRPVTDDVRLFEKLCLEGFQAGLSWITILRKRERFREVFAGFDPGIVAGFAPADVDRLLADPGIIRHRGKIEATIGNARAYLELADSDTTLRDLVWSFAPEPADRPERIDFASLSGLASTPASTALSKELKRRGFRFVGPTTVYAFMQAMGLVDDHLEGCDVRSELA
ncbi:MAG: DNA-3-methyladenine glycosylase I [Acidimicrobiales bacterium]